MWCASEVNPICGDCLANSAICWHRVDTISSSDALGMFPPSRPTTRRPLPSPGSPWSGFPCFAGTTRRSDFPSFFPPCFVAFAWRYHSSRLFSFLPKARRRPRDQELSVLAVPRRQLFKKWKRRDLPGSWRTQCAFAVFSDPGRTDASGLLDAPTRPPFRQRRRLQARGNFGAQSHGFGTGCLRFVRWVSPPGRKTRFWVLAKLSQAGLNTRRIPTRGFNGVLRHLPL